MRRPRGALIVGSGRSGTTLLQALVGSHPKIVTFPETHFCEATVGEYERRVFGRTFASAKHPFTYTLARLRGRAGLASPRSHAHWRSTTEVLGYHRRWLPFAGLFKRPNLRAFVSLFEDVARSAGADFWLEKSPNHVHYLPELFRIVPDLRVIHVVRRGDEVVASMVRAAERHPASPWQNVADPADAVARWNRALQAAIDAARQPNQHVIRYEMLARNPNACVQAVFKFLGVRDYPEALTEYRQQAQRIITDQEPWKLGTSSSIANTGEGRFRKMFSNAEQNQIRRSLLYEGIPPDWLGAPAR